MSRARRACVFSAIISAAISPALASNLPMPDLGDPDPYCRTLGPTHGPHANDASELSTDECRLQMRDGYDTAKLFWPFLSDGTVLFCTSFVTKSVTGEQIPADKVAKWGWVMFGKCIRNLYFDYDLDRKQVPPPY
jgi:hypothetical protein